MNPSNVRNMTVVTGSGNVREVVCDCCGLKVDVHTCIMGDTLDKDCPNCGAYAWKEILFEE